MTSRRFQPRAYTTQPEAFGKTALIEWVVPATTEDADRQKASMLQHNCVLLIRIRMKQRGLKLVEYATHTGLSYDRTAKMFRGEVMMRFEDLAQADRILGDVLRDDGLGLVRT